MRAGTSTKGGWRRRAVIAVGIPAIALVALAGMSLAEPLGPELSINDVALDEGDAGNTDAVFTIQLSEALTTSVKVTYSTANGTATAGSDYNRARGSVSFAPGETSKDVIVTVRGDTVPEADETFFVRLSSPKGAVLGDGEAVGRILNDDGSGLFVNDVTVAEGDSGTSLATFTVGLDSPNPGPGAVTFDIATADVTATAPSDYVARSLTGQEIPEGGQFTSFAVEVNGDVTFESDETFRVVLSNASTDIVDGEGVGTISNDDPEAQPALSITGQSIQEGDSGTTDVELTVSLSPASHKRVSVRYATAAGTAKAGEDYQSTNGQLIFARGETSKTVHVLVYGDGDTEEDEAFTVNLSDASNAVIVQGQAVVTILDDDDQPPVAVDDSATVTEDSGANAIDVLANDTDTDGGPISITSTTQPTNGTVAITGGGTGLTYAPAVNYCNAPPGTTADTFTYTLTPGGSTATVSVSVTCVDDPPVAVDDSATVTEDSGANAIDVLANDPDVDGGPKAVASVTQATNGTVAITGGGTGLTYTPNADYCTNPPLALDTFTYTLSPGGSTATVSVSVTCVDDPPVAVDDSATVVEDSSANAIDVLANDTDIDGGAISITSTTDPANGTVTITGGGTGLTYTPDANYCNDPPGTTPDTFTYTLDPGGSTATVSVTVTCVDDPPTAVDDSATVTEDSSANAIDVLSNDPDLDGGPKAIASVTQPANGTAAITGGGTGLTYTPDANYCNDGEPLDTFTYTLAPGGDTATVSVTVTCADDPPVAVDDSATVSEDSSANAIDVLANDTDPDGGAISITSVTQPANGTVTITGDGTGLTYTPDPNYCNDGDPLDTFTYTLAPGGSTATVSVTVTCVAEDATVTTSAGPLPYTENDPASAVDPGVTIDNPDGATLTDASVSITGNFQSGQDVLDWVDNDTSDDITEGASTAQTVLLAGDGTSAEYQAALRAVTYVNTSDSPSSLTRTVTFAITGSSTDTIDITVTSVDDAPLAVDDSATVVEDSGANAIDVLANDTDVDGGPRSITSVIQPANGTVAITGGGTGLTYTPDPNYCNDPPLALDTFTYTLTPGGSTATTSMSVTCVNDAPVVANEAYDTVGNTVLRVDNGTAVAGQVHVIGDVLANDSDVEGDPLVASIANPATDVTTGAIVSMEPDGEFTYTPPPGRTATDAFTYTVSDGQDTSTGTVTVTFKGMVWYVDNQATAGGMGRSADPFDTLAEAQTASAANDTIHVDRGDGTTTGQASGIALKAGQRLLGEGVELSVPVSVNAGPNPTVLRPAGQAPRIDNSTVGGNGVSVTSGSAEIRGLDIAGTADGIDLTSSTSGTAVIEDNVVRSAGTTGIDLNLASPGSLTLFLSRNQVTAAGTAVDLAAGAGSSATVREFASNAVSGTTGGSGVATSGAVVFDASSLVEIQPVDGGTTTIGSSGDPVGGGGLLLNGAAGWLQFADLDVFAGGGTALLATGTGPGLTLAAGVQGGAAATLSAVGGPALSLSGVTLTLPDAALTSTNSPTTGVSLTNVSGTLSTTSGSAITGATGAAVAISGGTATVTYNGTVGNTAGRSVDIQGRTGGTVTLAGAITDSGQGILLNANSGSTLAFSGTLSLSTGTNPAFTATGGGTVSATNTASTIVTTTGTALTVANTTIGTGGLQFRSISAGTTVSGPANGIVLTNTGATAGLTVTGTGSTATGGTIQRTTGDAVSLTSTRAVSLSWMAIKDNLGSGINGSSVTDFTLASSTVDNNGDDGAADEAGVRFTNLLGTASITNSTVSNSIEDNARIINSSGTLSQLTVSGSTFRDTEPGPPGNNGLLVQADGTASITADITTSSFLRNRANGVQVVTNGGGSIDVEVGTAAANSGGTFTDNNIGVNIAHNSTGTLAFDVRNATISTPGVTGAASPINLNLGGCATTLMSGTVTNTTISNNNSLTGPGVRVVSNGPACGGPGGTMTVAITNNVISQVAAQGIQVLARDGSSRINATIRNNTVTLTQAGSLDGIRIDSGAVSTDTTTVCADVAGNTSTTIAGQFGIRVRQRFAGTSFLLEGYGGSATDDAAVAAYLNARNTTVTPGAAADHGGAGFATIVNCPEPS